MARILVALFALTLAGCRGGPSDERYREAFEEKLRLQNELLSLLRSVRDEGSMQAAAGKLADLSVRDRGSAEKLIALGEPPEGVKEEFAPRLFATFGELRKESGRILKLAGGEQFLDTMKNTKPGP